MSYLKVVAAVLALVAAGAARPDHGAAPPAPQPAYGAPPPPPTYAPPPPPPPPPTYAPPPRPTYAPPPPPTYAPPPPPTYAPPPPPQYGQPEPETAKPAYSFDWAVKDDYSGNDFGHQENRDGYNTQGSYYVLLPDGRVERVTYTVNKDSGFVATVEFEGEAKVEEKPYGQTPAPTYGQT
ncbi:uncharacterized protein LOC127000530 isoform X2 [Eriocheir sinensis]|uniref:uncharacterized protein LOC127000530 isoform X2 n=1 Tax=Eriocheir sinensis TaxID=95602 RepID=UPI0021C96B70|nr:uncharacterized protein LOC127000530 isoform X2 [Eriocheir sinensis]